MANSLCHHQGQGFHGSPVSKEYRVSKEAGTTDENKSPDQDAGMALRSRADAVWVIHLQGGEEDLQQASQSLRERVEKGSAVASLDVANNGTEITLTWKKSVTFNAAQSWVSGGLPKSKTVEKGRKKQKAEALSWRLAAPVEKVSIPVAPPEPQLLVLKFLTLLHGSGPKQYQVFEKETLGSGTPLGETQIFKIRQVFNSNGGIFKLVRRRTSCFLYPRMQPQVWRCKSRPHDRWQAGCRQNLAPSWHQASVDF